MSKKQTRKQDERNCDITILFVVGEQSTWLHKLRKMILLHKTKLRLQNCSNPKSSRTWLHNIQVGGTNCTNAWT